MASFTSGTAARTRVVGAYCYLECPSRAQHGLSSCSASFPQTRLCAPNQRAQIPCTRGALEPAPPHVAAGAAAASG